MGAASAGSLESSDESMSDRYVDAYEISVSRGDSLDITVSGNFDTTLRVVGPGGEEFVNDDAPDYFGLGNTDSGLTAEFSRSGTARVYVSSYYGGDTGDYELFIGEEGDRPSIDDLPSEEIRVGRTITGSIAGDTTFEGSPAAVYRLQASRGDRLAISVTSDNLDTTLLVQDAGDSEDYSDDVVYEQRWADEFDLPGETDSALIFEVQESGPLHIVVRDYYGSIDGDFELLVERR